MVERAVELARAAAGVGPAVEGRALRVRRLDRPGTQYYLVLLGEEAVAAVDVDGGAVLSWAAVSGLHLVVDEDEARQLAGARDLTQPQLVWRSSAESRSPLYPLWEVRLGESSVYVDQQRSVWPELHPAGRGG